MTKTRFAPSPTGYMHLGNIRTALFCALLAKNKHGRFLLRVEDTDQTRSTIEFTEHLFQDLHWLGLDWQEGPEVGGENGPYFQSERQAIYDKYYRILEEQGLAYPCFCTEQELAISRKAQLSAGLPPRYAGTCRKLTPEQVNEKKAKGLIATLRFRVPDNQNVEFDDIVRGIQRFNTNEIGDFIIRRGDGTSAFFFCNAIDDAVMGVTHVLRGEDHLTNTPRQLLILQALNLPKTAYGHISMIVGTDGSPLSKRHGSRSIKELRGQGYLPIAINNYSARLGHYYAENNLMSLDDLGKNFSLENIGTSPARYDPIQLLYWQKQAVQQLSASDFWQWLGKEIKPLIPEATKNQFIDAIRANIFFPEEAQLWAHIFFKDELVYTDEAIQILKQAGAAFFQAAIVACEQYKTDFKAITQTLSQTLSIKGKALFQPLRVALTGQSDGPEMVKITELLGSSIMLKRLSKALGLCEHS